MGPIPNSPHSAGNLWKRTLAQIGDEQLKTVLETTARTQKRDILPAVMQTARESEQVCIRKRLRFRDVDGNEIVTCDLFQKMAFSIKQFEQASQNGLPSDPIDAFLLWALVRYLLRKPIDDAQEYGLVISELEQTVRVITECAQVERQSLHQQSYHIRDTLEMALAHLYAEIYAHLGRMIRYYKANSFDTMEESNFRPGQNSMGIDEIMRQARHIPNLAQLDEAQAAQFLEPNFVRSSPSSLVSWKTLTADSQERLNSWLAPLPLNQSVRNSSAFNSLLDNPQFRSWHLSSSSCLLFIQAPDGWSSADVDKLWDAAQETISLAPFAQICCADLPYGNEGSLSDAIMRTILSHLLTHKNDETKIRELLWADFERQSALARVRGQHLFRLNSHECVQLILELAEQDPLTVVITAIDKVKEVDRHSLMEALKEIAVNSGNVAKILVSCGDDINVFSTLAQDHLGSHGFLSTQHEGGASFNAICSTGCMERKDGAESLLPEGNIVGNESQGQTPNEPEKVAVRLAKSNEPLQTLAEYELAVLEATEAGSVTGLGRLEYSNFYHQLFSKENKEKVTSMARKAIQGGHIGALAWYLKASSLTANLLPVNAVAVAVLYSDLSMVRYLLDKGMSIETEGQFGSPLVTASLLNRQAIVLVLIQLGANVNAKGTFGSALDIAVMKGHTSIVKLLLDSGASFFRGGGVHGSILQAAAFHGHLDTIELLLDAGADDSIGGYTKDALHAAIDGGHADIVFLLLTRGFPSRPRDRLRGKEQWPARSRSRDLLREASPERIAREDGEYDESEGEEDDLKAAMPLTNLEAIFEADQHPWTRKQSSKTHQERGSFKYINALDSAVRSGHDSVAILILSLADALDLGNNAAEKATVVAVEQGQFSILDLLLKHLATRIPIAKCLESLFDAVRRSKFRDSSLAKQVFTIASQYCTAVELDKFKAETFTVAHRYEASDDLSPGLVAQDLKSACTHGRLGELLTIIGSRQIGQLKPEQLAEALHLCAMCGHYSLFKSLFEFLQGSDYLHDMSKVSDSCLVAAAANGQLDIVKLLISLRETTPFSAMTIGGALVNACERGYSQVAQYLVRNASASVNEPACDSLLGLLSEFPFEADIWRPSRSSSKDTESSLPAISPLQAALRGFTEADCGYTRNGFMQRNINPRADPERIVKVLLDLGANPNELGGQHMYPIQVAAELCSPSVVRQLIEVGADVNVTVGEDSAIFKAAGREVSSGEVLKVLMDSGAKFPDEETTIQKLFGKPLYYFDPYPQVDGCSSRGRGFQVDQTLQEVLKHGPGAAISTFMALYPQWRASDKRCGHILQMAAFLNHYDLVATLLSRGVDVNAAGHYYGTALQAAARCGHNDMVLRLLSSGAQVNTLRGQWETALRAAIVGGHEDVVRTLLDNGADFKLVSAFKTENHGDVTSSCLQLAVRTNKVGIVNALLGAGAVPSDDESDSVGGDQPPLIITALRGNLEIAKILIDSGADVNVEGRKRDKRISLDDEHASPLCAAISKKKRNVVKLLLERGAEVNQTDRGCRSPISLAVDVQDQSLVRLLLKHGAKIGTALSEAAEHNHLGIVQDLLAAGARVDIRQGPWGNPFVVALKKPYGREMKDLRIIETLLEALMETPDPEPIIEEALSEAIKGDNSRDIDLILDYLPASALRLRQACSAGTDQAVKRILQHGVNPNEADGNGDYPLHIAAAHLQPAVVNTLIQHGADLHATTREGKIPLQAALEACAKPRLDLSNSASVWQKPKRVTARKRRRLFKWPQDAGSNPPIIAFPRFYRCELITATLLDNGASPVSVTNSGAGSPLHLACLIGSKNTIVRLLEKGADVNEIGGHFGHVLLIAIATSRPDLVAILLQHGADPNYLDEHNGTPLHLAGKMNSTLSVKHLLEHGADAAKRDADGNLPLDVALKSAEAERRNSGHVRGKDTVQSLLKSAGGNAQETNLSQPARCSAM